MKRFVEGEDRLQGSLLPHCLDDYVTEDNPVRVIEAFIDELDLATLGFEGVVPETTGRPAYHPATLLKIYLYGYLNRVQSSRRLDPRAQPVRAGSRHAVRTDRDRAPSRAYRGCGKRPRIYLGGGAAARESAHGAWSAASP